MIGDILTTTCRKSKHREDGRKYPNSNGQTKIYSKEEKDQNISKIKDKCKHNSDKDKGKSST